MKVNIKNIDTKGSKNITKRDEISLNIYSIQKPEFKENEIVELKIDSNIFDATISYVYRETNKEIYIASKYKKYISNNSKIEINKKNKYDIKKYQVLPVELLKDNKVVLPKKSYNRIFNNRKVNSIRIVNNLNGYQILLTKKECIENMNEEEDVIRLGIKYRKLLDLELPTYISESYLKELEKKGDIRTLYKNEECDIEIENYYKQVQQLRDIINKTDINRISIYPIEDKKIKFNILKKVYEKILSFFIGQTQIDLRVIRPHDIDESENIVRLSESSMKLLGINETDTIDIYYKSKKVTARVLLFDGFDMVKNENRIRCESELNLLIGIPAYLRQELDIPYINYIVRVKRNLKYFFRKYLNNQMITIIGFILSLSAMEKIENNFLKIGLIIILLIGLIYISFSEIRESISNK